MAGMAEIDGDGWLLDLFAQVEHLQQGGTFETAEPVVDTPVATPATKGCTRCGGKGYLPHFQHNKGGECFACHGSGHK